MVGIGDSSANDDPFVIEHNDGTGSDLFGGDVLDLDLLASAPAPFKDLDADMGGTEATVPPAAQPAPPAEDPNDSQTDPIGRMRRLKSLHAEGLITDDEFQQKRAQILKDV
jgi:hypothetical protein